MRPLVRLIQKTYRMVDPIEAARVLHNVTSLSGLQVVTYFFPIVIVPYLFRVIGPEKFGLISFAQAFVQYFMIVTDYGFSVSATKEISLHIEDKEKVLNIISAVMTIKAVMVFLCFLVLGAAIYFIPKFHHDWPVYVLSFGFVVGSALFPAWFYQGSESMKYIAKLNIIGEFIYAFGVFLYIRRPGDYLLVPALMSMAAIITGLLGQYILFARFNLYFRMPKLKDLRHQLKAGWNIFISVVAINTYTTTRIFAVGLLTNNTLTGFYSVAERIANAVQTFPLNAFSQAIFPRMSKIFHKNKTKAFTIMQHVQLITIIISLIFVPLIFILAPLIVKLVCGGTYPEAILSLRFLLVSVFCIASNAFRVQFLLVCGKTGTYSKIHLTMAAIGLPLIIAFIYAFSYVGAAMASTLIEAGVLTATYIIVKKLPYAWA
ncbi:MAG: flippase [Candidatus Omnitrophica bacterium]|nr:flippase [Candidatus Omnitrophota bacterium]MDE2213791.1 flippase [Candidatus Omnitrophota bacterium]MDE2230633.1 flippase [Candidatus Omnitrophota bacterium]